MRSVTMAIARSMSIIGHPFLVVPSAVLAVLLHRDAASTAAVAVPVCGVCVGAFAFSLWQVHRGRWQHIDASVTTERSSLNLFLATVLLIGAAVGFYQKAEPGLSIGLLLSGLLIVLAMMVSPWAKLSLHAAFAAFSVLLLWSLTVWHLVLAGAAAAGICWSRVVLGRHTIGEVLAGSGLGALFGACFWFMLTRNGR